MNIAQLKHDVTNGVSICSTAIKELVNWAYERRHVEPNEANFHRLVAKLGFTKKQEGYIMGAYRESFAMEPRYNLPKKEQLNKEFGKFAGHESLADMIKGHIGNWRDALKTQRIDQHDTSYIDHELKALDAIEMAVIDRAGIGQPSMPVPKDAIEIAVERTNVFNRAVEKLAESIYTAWPESTTYPWQAWGNSFKQDEARATARKLLTDKTRPAVECGDEACPRCTTGKAPFENTHIKPEVLKLVDWLICERIGNEDHVDEALRGFKDDPTGDNATGLIRAVLTVYIADTASLAALPLADDQNAAPRPATQAYAQGATLWGFPVTLSPAMDLLADHIASGKHVPRPMTQAPAWHNPASAIANLERYVGEDNGIANGNNDGEYVRYVDVCKAFGVEP